MKGVPIKFRAKGIDGNVYFGNLNFFEKTWGISGVTADGIKTGVVGYDFTEVEPDTIAQLCGYDADGNEVYEGDTLLDSGGNEFQAELWAMGVNPIDADGLNNGCINFFLKKEE